MDVVIDFAEEDSTNLPVFLHLISLSRKSLVSKEGIISARDVSVEISFPTRILD